MTTQNYDSSLDLVNERLKQIDEISAKFVGFPDVQKKLLDARNSLVESEEEIMTYYDLTNLEKYNKP
jgi:hypothetical protein